MWSASGIQSSGPVVGCSMSGVVSGCSVRSLLRAVAYDSPVLAIRARTRRLKSACLVMIVSRVPTADPPATAAAGARSVRQAPAERWASLCLRRVTGLGQVAGGWARTVADSTVPGGRLGSLGAGRVQPGVLLQLVEVGAAADIAQGAAGGGLVVPGGVRALVQRPADQAAVALAGQHALAQPGQVPARGQVRAQVAVRQGGLVRAGLVG